MSDSGESGLSPVNVRNEIRALADSMGLDYDALTQQKRTQYEQGACVVCGAAVAAERVPMHSRWHLLIDLRYLVHSAGNDQP